MWAASTTSVELVILGFNDVHSLMGWNWTKKSPCKVHAAANRFLSSLFLVQSAARTHARCVCRAESNTSCFPASDEERRRHAMSSHIHDVASNRSITFALLEASHADARLMVRFETLEITSREKIMRCACATYIYPALFGKSLNASPCLSLFSSE